LRRPFTRFHRPRWSSRDGGPPVKSPRRGGDAVSGGFDMVTFMRRASINGIENQQKAIGWASKVARYAEDKFAFSNVRTGLEVYGRVGGIYWLAEQESLESLAKATQATVTDADYRQLLNEARGLFVPGSVEDTVILGF